MRVVRSLWRPGQGQKLLTLVLAVGAGISLARADERPLVIDAARSRVVIHVGKTGAFSFAGHDHEIVAPAVNGRILYAPANPSHSSVSVVFDAARLQVTGANEPAKDVAEVQQTMLSLRVLDVARFPTIAFESTQIAVQSTQAGRLTLQVAGDLTLHGKTKPLTVPVAVTVEGRDIQATGNVRVKQTDFGMTPVTAGGGTVRVKDDVEIAFTLHAHQ